MRLAYVVAHVVGQPVIATSHRCRVAHPLLNDAPLSFRRENERMMVELIAVLHRGVVDLGRDATGVNERLRVASEALARRRDLGGRLARCRSLASRDKDAEVALDT